MLELDPITGDKLSWGERGLSLLFIIPPIKIGKYGAKGFKFVTEGIEDLNKINKKADKGKEVEKSTKKADGAKEVVGVGKSSKIKPSLSEGRKPIGDYSPPNSRGLIKRNETANLFFSKGYKTEMLDEVSGGND